MSDSAGAFQEFRAAGFFGLRTALLPFTVLEQWADGTLSAQANRSELADAVAADRVVLTARLKTLVRRPEVREALLLATDSTERALDAWLGGRASAETKLERTLTKYIQRMAGRATPFGLFAGQSTGTVDPGSECSRIVLAPLAKYRRRTRVDMDHMIGVCDQIGRLDTFRERATYFPNTSLVKHAGRWRYVHARVRAGVRSDSLVALETDEFLEAVITTASARGALLRELVEAVCAVDPDTVTAADAGEYVVELIDRQVLICSLSPRVTGDNMIEDLAVQMDHGDAGTAAAAQALRSVDAELKALDSCAPGVPRDHYETIRKAIAALGTDAEPARLFQVDLLKPLDEGICGRDLMVPIEACVRALALLPPLAGDKMASFVDAFRSRYEQREVPLLEALDEESGTGFMQAVDVAPLLDNLPIGLRENTREAPRTGSDGTLVRLFDRWRVTGSRVLDVTLEQLDELGDRHRRPLPDAFCAFLKVTSDPTYRVVVTSVAGPSGVNFLSRFADADPTLLERMREHLAAEAALRPDAVFAELVHLPDGRGANVSVRPLLRDYEIVYLGRSGAPIAAQIPASDLLVSVVRDRVVLRSRRLGREVVPRLTTAHNAKRGQALYQFFAAMQDGHAHAWTWGPLEALDYLPRVVCGPVVLSRARWRLDGERIRSFAAGTEPQQYAAVKDWQRAHAVPRFAVLAEGDHELPIDFNNVLSVDTFVDTIKGRTTAILVEAFPAPDALAVRGPEGMFVGEMVVPFLNASTNVARPAPPFGPAPRLLRSFPPGSPWIYMKLYAGNATLDHLLTTSIAPRVRSLMESRAARLWFFIRYKDPDWHLRLRLRADDDESATVCSRLFDAMETLKDAGVWRTQVDTYEREIERYGGDDGMELCEQVFWHDSEAVLTILQTLPEDDPENARWRLCLRSWHGLLDAFALPLAERLDFVRSMRNAQAARFGDSKALKVDLGKRFRAERKTLEDVLYGAPTSGDTLHPAVVALDRRAAKLAPVFHELRQRERSGRLTTGSPSLAASFLHMHVYRLLRGAQAPHEFVLYDFLTRLYESAAARLKNRSATITS